MKNDRLSTTTFDDYIKSAGNQTLTDLVAKMIKELQERGVKVGM